MTQDLKANRLVYFGLFAVAMATLMYEILLTRIFSVTMWYHFAFVAVSVAMFGMTAGAIIVYLCPKKYSSERVLYQLGFNAFWFAITIILSFLTHIDIPLSQDISLTSVLLLGFHYSIITVPFVFSGICISLALTKFNKQVGSLYFTDLFGAALGCLAIIFVLEMVDGITAVFVVSLIACIGAALFALETNERRVFLLSTGASICLIVFCFVNHSSVQQGEPILHFKWLKGKPYSPALYETWNSYSRLRVRGDLEEKIPPFGWGLSKTRPRDSRVLQLLLDIDSDAGTVLTGFDGDLDTVDHLRFDIINAVHYIRSNSDVLVIGVGGGRDILSALLFDQASILAVELNHDILRILTEEFGEFTGHIGRNPKVELVNDEARSYIARTDKRFDIIQISFIDTWAATAAGAFVLSENALYTKEAWHLFLDRLSPGGVLSVGRWYFEDQPGEMYRITALTAAALRERGVKDPEKHIMIVRKPRSLLNGKELLGEGVGTLLVSINPFQSDDVAQMKSFANEMEFELVLYPSQNEEEYLDPTFNKIVNSSDLESFTEKFPINISPPTDDSPFFFNMLRLRDIFNSSLWDKAAMSFNIQAMFILGSLLMIVSVLTLLCFVVPLILTVGKAGLSGSSPLFLFFGGIGLGFMIIEIAQMQRLIVFLGHPTYGLSVVLFTLLLSTGIGSMLTEKIDDERLFQKAIVRFSLLLLTVFVVGLVTLPLTSAFQSSTNPMRVLLSIGLLAPMGIFMGMAFPIGMRISARKFSQVMPWFWGINGATSVFASVLAIVIAIASSISISYWVGFACYCVAFVGLLRCRSSRILG